MEHKNYATPPVESSTDTTGRMKYILSVIGKATLAVTGALVIALAMNEYVPTIPKDQGLDKYFLHVTLAASTVAAVGAFFGFMSVILDRHKWLAVVANVFLLAAAGFAWMIAYAQLNP